MSDLCFETLESRLLLAGNVRAVLQGDTLVITGDGAANQFRVDGTDGNLQVAGFLDTSVNGVLNGSEGFTGVVNIVINTKGGNDAINFGELSKTELAGDLTIKTGGGDDAIQTFDTVGVTIRGKTIVKTGGGMDYLECVSASFMGQVDVNLGGGRDRVFVQDTTFLDSLLVNGGGGFDHFMDVSGNTITVPPVFKSIEDFSNIIN